MKRVFIIHGWGGTPESNWFPWLKHELENRIEKIKVFVPLMPNTENPKAEEWLSEISLIVNKPDENCYFIGHSLGVIAIMRYLESLPENTKIGGAIFVAGFPESVGIKETESFFEKKVNFKKIKKSTNSFVVIDSDDDPYVPSKNANMLEKELGAKRIIIKNGGHLNAGTGYFKFTEVLNSLYEMID